MLKAMGLALAAYLAFLGGLVALAAAGVWDHAVTGRVRDARSFAPLAGAAVEARGLTDSGLLASALTDRDGRFKIEAEHSAIEVHAPGYATAVVYPFAFTKEVLVDPLPADHEEVRTGSLRATDRGRFVFPRGANGPVPLDVPPPADADLEILSDTAGVRFRAFGSGGVSFLPATDFPEHTDLSAVTCQAPSAGYLGSITLNPSAPGVLFVRTADGNRYAKIWFGGPGAAWGVWYNPTGGRGLCGDRSIAEVLLPILPPPPSTRYTRD